MDMYCCSNCAAVALAPRGADCACTGNYEFPTDALPEFIPGDSEAEAAITAWTRSAAFAARVDRAWQANDLRTYIHLRYLWYRSRGNGKKGWVALHSHLNPQRHVY